MNVERMLVILLRLEAVVVLLALPAVFLPTSWMAEVHRWLGLGTMPEGVLVEYLTRSLSALYASWAPVYFLVATDVRHYQKLIVVLALVRIVFGIGMLGIDLVAGAPLYWTITEGPSIALLSVVVWLLARRIRSTDQKGGKSGE